MEFFHTLWPVGLPEGGHLVLAIKREGKMSSEFYSDVDKAGKRALEIGKTVDVYFGMAAQPRVPKGRGTTDTALAIPGLWLDLDFSKGFNDVEGVQRFIAALPLRPTLLVSTGGGIHAHWLFQESLSAKDSRAASLELGWLQYCRQVARLESKAELDAVADLARVLRVPGTSNFKRAQPVPVFILQQEEIRYEPSAFQSWQVETRARNSAISSVTLEFALRDDAQPPFDKWHVAATNQHEIPQIMEHKIKMPVDNSLSGYDLSLATRLDALNWTPQEIVDTIITHRRKWLNEITDPGTSKDPLHITDPGYFERILRKAKTANDRDRISQETITLAEEVTDELDSSATVDSSVRAKWFLAMSGMLGGVKIVDLWAVDSIEGSWHVRIQCDNEMRDVRATSRGKILQWNWWVELVLGSRVAVDSLPSKPPVYFRDLVQRSGSILRVIGNGQSVRASQELESYLSEVADAAPDFKDASVLEGQSFLKVDDGPLGLSDWGEPEECLFIRSDSMHFDMKVGRCPPLANPVHALVELGFVHRVVKTRLEGSRGTTRNYYCYPLRRLRARALAAAGEGGAEGWVGAGEGDEGEAQ